MHAVIWRSFLDAKPTVDSIVARIAAIDAHLSGEDSPLATPWEEIKYQLQTELSPDWEAYRIAIEQTISGFVYELTPAMLADLRSSLGCSSQDEVEQKLLNRIIQRGKKEKVKYRPFDFSYFCYPLLDFTVYAKVIERTGWQSCVVSAYSGAAPRGERGEVSTNHIEYILTQEDFEKARSRGWPGQWEAEVDKVEPKVVKAADAASVSAEDLDALINEVLAERNQQTSGQITGKVASHAETAIKKGFAGLDAIFGRKGK